MAEVLLEVGIEEIPSRFMARLLLDLKMKVEKKLADLSLSFKDVQTVGTDRRFALIINGLAESQADINKELKGPPAEMAFKDGKLTPAGEGFCKKNGLDPAKVEKKNIGGKDYLFAAIHEKGRKTKELLPEIYKAVLLDLHLPIAMRWGNLDLQFIRPIHWLVSLYDEHVLSFDFAEIKAGRKTMGHRFISNKQLEIETPANYAKVLEKHSVFVDQNLRKDMILAQIKQIEADKKLKAVISQEVLNEVTFINECPVAVVAEIDEKFLAVPQECLIATMQKNQKYFPLVDSHGKLTKYFILISNNVNKNSLPNIIKGNVKVVTARLEDAKFFFEEDKKHKLEEMTDGLKKVTYQEKIGTIYQKIERTVQNAEWLAKALGLQAELEQIKRTAWLCKGDLNSKMVYEFPELQGTMGRYYALAQGEAEVIAQAIADHWRPKFAGDDISKISKVAAVVAIADKLDTIASCYTAGLIPTSSSDPYALRRAAQGIVSLLIAHNFNLEMGSLITQGLSHFAGTKVQPEISSFFVGRLKNVLQERQISYDVIDAVMAAPTEDIFRTIAFADALGELKSDKAFIETAVRVNSITDKEKNTNFNESELVEDVEKVLAKTYQAVAQTFKQKLGSKQYGDAIITLLQLVGPVTAFFDKVMVMDKDLQVRNNRVGLLKSIDNLFAQVGAFKKLVL